MRATGIHFLSAALGFTLLGCAKEEDVELTSWFTVRYSRPAVSWSYPLRDAAKSAVALTRIDSSWHPVDSVHGSTYFRAVPFAGDTRVLVFGGVGNWQIFREGSLVPNRIPRERCESFAYVAGESGSVICPKCRPAEGRHWGCDRLRLHVLDGDGHVLLDREVDLASASTRVPTEAEFVGLLEDDTVLFNIRHSGPEPHPLTACRLIGVSAAGEQTLVPETLINYCYRLSQWPRPTRDLRVRLPSWDSHDQFDERISPGCG